MFHKERGELEPGLIVKSELMLQHGENDKEVDQKLIDLYDAGCDKVNLGHYPAANYLKLQ